MSMMEYHAKKRQPDEIQIGNGAGLGSISPQWGAPIRSKMGIGACLGMNFLIGFGDVDSRPAPLPFLVRNNKNNYNYIQFRLSEIWGGGVM